MHLRYKNIYQAIFLLSFFLVVGLHANSASAANVGDTTTFNIDSSFDISERSQISAVLVKTAPSLHFYIEKSWWDMQPLAKQAEILAYLQGASSEFDNKIHPTLTSIFGSDWNPGVDGDDKITILLHSMKETAGGYFRSADEYLKLQIPSSNEREMLYLPIAQIDSTKLKIFLAHEFTHLITFNQKDRLRNVQEEVWLNEARADYSSAILGYDNTYDGSTMQQRVRDFLAKPNDSLTEWQDSRNDYAVASVFIHYLVDHYGLDILASSLKSKSIGVASINEALKKNGYTETFEDIFTDWTVAIVLNDCGKDLKYCYLQKNLTSLRLSPTLMFLPISGSSSLSSTNVTKNWSGNWQKIIGGNGDLELEFSSLAGLNFSVPYILFNDKNQYTVHKLTLDADERGSISVKDFGTKYTSLVIMPSLQTKLSGFNGLESTYPYTLKISINGEEVQGEDSLIQKLLEQIEQLKKQIAALQAGQNPNANFCSQITINLFVGVNNKSEVMCLQAFLKNQSNVYPEGLVTGFYGGLTRAAVMRFQAQYQIPTTGYVGPLTRAKINEFLR